MVMLSAVRTDNVDRALAGIGMTLVAMLIFSGMDGISKVLTADYHPFEIACLRSLFTIAALAPFVARDTRTLRTVRPWHQIGRGLCMIVSSIFFIWGLSGLPIADASAIGFVSPLFVTALSIPLLGEQVGIRRWSAVLVGFVGVLIVVRPGSGTFNPAAVFPLASAVAWALGLILTRQMRSSEPVLTTIVYSTVVGIAVTGVALPVVWVAPDLQGWLLMALMGVLSAVGQTMMIVALTRAPASLLSPFSYSQMLWSTLIGLFVFETVPDAVTWLGAAIVIASGLYILHRESVVHRRRAMGGA
jgi:drug/metabolite transporter (DMT)-like permease